MSFALEGNYWDIVRPTFIEQWPDPVTSLSIEQYGLELGREDAITLGRSIGEWGEVWWEHFGPATVADVLRRELIVMWLDQIAKRWYHRYGGFVRLGSRSPKDSWDGHNEKFQARDGKTAWRFLTDMSERVHDDLSQALAHDYRPWLWMREWISIPASGEFRCFMHERELVGISQYDHREFFAHYSNKQMMDDVAASIRDEFFPRFRDASHLDSVVFDVFIDSRRDTTFTLLEINPFFAWTDPCMFDWRKPEMFDGRFLYRTIEDKIDVDIRRAEKYAALLDGE